MSRARLRRYFRHGLFPQLLVFEAVARLGGVTRAAEELHLAQPTVSVQLKKLAEALEVTLFEPDGRRLRLTPAGAALLPLCAELVDLFARADERLAVFRGKKTEVLRLAAGPEARSVPSRLVAARGRELARVAAAFVREALADGAYNLAPEDEPWNPRGTTTPPST